MAFTSDQTLQKIDHICIGIKNTLAFPHILQTILKTFRGVDEHEITRS